MTLWIKYLAVSILMLTSLSSPLCLSFCATLYIAKITSASPMATVISTRKHRDCSSLRGGREKEGTQLAREGTHQLGGGASMARSLPEPWEAGMQLDSVWGMTHMKIAWILFSILGRCYVYFWDEVCCMSHTMIISWDECWNLSIFSKCFFS